MDELERQADCSEMNIEYLVKLYKRHHPGDAVWRLIQDINRQVTIWTNIVEGIKRADDPEAAAQNFKRRFEKEFKAVPPGSIDFWALDLEKGFKKLANYGKGLLKIARSHFEELASDLNVQPGTTVTMEAQIGLSPSKIGRAHV